MLLCLCACHEPQHAPQIEKLGTIGVDLMESTPFVFNGTLYRLEYLRENSPHNKGAPSFQRIVDVETGTTVASLGRGFHFPSAYVSDDTLFIYAVPAGGAPEIQVFWSRDLKTWSSQEALGIPGWGIFNTSVTRGPRGFVMAFEVGSPEDVVGERFTTFFAESDDLRNWRLVGRDRAFSKDFYSACPTLRYVNGYYYVLYLSRVSPAPKAEYATHIARSRDLSHWELSPRNPVLSHSLADYRIHNPELTAAEKKRVANAVNINNSDVDLCEHDGKVIIYYSWGNQFYVDHLAEARFNGTESGLLESFWEP